MSSACIRNFGRNISFRPAHHYSPANEADVLAILDRHRGESFRTVGRLHAWSEAVVTQGVLLDLHHLDHVVIERSDDGPRAVVGAGCQIKRLLVELGRHGLTTPSVGLITEQTIAGAISTGTHGSGRHSLSHYIDEVRVAVYDPETGAATIRIINWGDELRAARCSLGCLGVIVSVRFRPRSQYLLEEHVERYQTVEEVLVAEEVYPLQQFFLMPWLWQYYAQHRRESNGPPSRSAPLYQLYWLLGLDVGWHLILLILVRVLKSPWMVRRFFQKVLPRLVVRNWRVTDRADKLLVIEHELFRHIEIEIFVRKSHLPSTLDFVRGLLNEAAGLLDTASLARARVTDIGLSAELDQLVGRYHHHYPICVRKVVADDTLISPAAGDASTESWYAVSFISYASPAERQGFVRFAELLARSTAKLYGARPHWGKVCPLNGSELPPLYPQIERFRSLCDHFDPRGVFRNEWTTRTLGLEQRRVT